MQQTTQSEQSAQPAHSSAVPRAVQSPRAKLVYLYLSTHGATTLTDLETALDMKKLSLYSILRTLVDREFVTRDAEHYEVR
jgi:DNA-binding MarR family transcriptional regulator